MNLPQFTAGLALSRTNGVYREYGDSIALDEAQMSGVRELIVPAGGCPSGCIGSPPDCRPGGGPGGGNQCATACACSCANAPNQTEEGYNFCYQECSAVCTQPAGECVAPPGSCAAEAYVQCCKQNQNLPVTSIPKDCGLLYGPCAAGWTCCPSGCVETGSDSENCGSCGHECEAGSACCSGSCCGGSAGGCSNEQGLGCGCCNLTNSQGGVTPTCVPVVKMVNGTPILQGGLSDSANCGTCGHVCGPAGDYVCCDGACCNAGQACCSDLYGDLSCTSLNTDRNCGACGNICQNGQNCVNGQCLCPDGQSSLDTNLNCGQCGSVCPVGTTCCNGACVNLDSNASNCGSCGNACPAGNACFNGCCVNTAPLLTSNNTTNSTNYWLSTAGGCQNIQDLLVAFEVSASADLSSPNGFTLQLNALPPPNSQNITWLQFVIEFNGSAVDAVVVYWGNGCTVFTNQHFNTSCCSNGKCCSGWDSFWDSIFGGSCATKMTGIYPPNILFAGNTAAIYLSTDPSSGNVTAANFMLFDQNGHVKEFPVSIPGNLQVPIQSFQFVAVGPAGGNYAQFSSGAGTIEYWVAPGQQLCVDGGSPACPSAPVYPGGTGETSNATYGPMSACCGNGLSQSFTA